MAWLRAAAHTAAHLPTVVSKPLSEHSMREETASMSAPAALAARPGSCSPEFEALAAGMTATGCYRVLRRLELPEAPFQPTDAPGTTVAVAVDLETTGLDPKRHKIVECCLRRFRFDACGRIASVDRSWTWLEDPGEPLDPAISKLIGLTDDDLRGRRIDDGAVADLVRSADLVTAFNAAFDRRFLERRLPACAGLAWACALREVDWRARGFDGSGRSLGWLLAQYGLFYGAHRAGADVDALIALLHHVDGTGRTACAEMVEAASRSTWRFRAVGAPFDVKDKLKARGYRWDGPERVWWREVADDARGAETAWLADEVYAPWLRPRLDGPAVDEVTWLTRHA